MNEHYGDIVEATEYFDMRLHEYAWSRASEANRTKSLVAATRLVDALNFKGYKNTVYELLESNPSATQEEIYEAETEQALEFPRGPDTEVPENIRLATYEIAHSLLDRRDPEQELENLGLTSAGISSVRSTFNRSNLPIEHIINMIPNAVAWRWIRPFLRDEDAVRLERVS